jgi:uncharacterized protein DUF5670
MVVLLMILWLLGVASAYTLGGLVYPMLVVERAVLFIDLITGRRLGQALHIFEDERLH